MQLTPSSPPAKTAGLVAIDAPMLVFQAFYGIPDTFHDAQGRSVNAVFGFALRLMELLAEIRHADTTPRIILCWDESLGSGFRHHLYPPYKANRPLADEAFLYQIQRCAEITEALGLCQRGSNEFEADDLIASLVHQQHAAGGSALVVSQDKDLAQLVTPGDHWWPYPKSEARDHAALLEHWQIPLGSIADYLALCGDAVDNIPGIRGVGAVTARVLLQAFPSLELLYDNLDAVTSLPIRGAAGLQKKLAAQRDEAFLYRELTRLRRDALSAQDWEAMQCVTPQPEALEQVMKACNLWSRVQKKATQLLGG